MSLGKRDGFSDVFDGDAFLGGYTMETRKRRKKSKSRRAKSRTTRKHRKYNKPRHRSSGAAGRKVYTAKNGAKYVKLANGRAKFIKR